MSLTTKLIFSGGLGKTQLALKYADKYRKRYPGGIFFLSAKSDSTIVADLSRVCESLSLNDASSTANRFKRWLSSRHHMNYLIIFDNADDPNSLSMSDYVPKINWGDILYTSRDQGIIGTLAQNGILLDQLSVQDATHILLQKAGVTNPSADDVNHAQGIVQQFGCLPLAIDQAGAYVRTRHKSLSAFKMLCIQRQSDILKFKPRLAQYDQTIFTTWELNFEQVEQRSEDARRLMLLFCYLDAASIHEGILARACSPQKRWSPDGEVMEVSPFESGIDKDLVDTVQDELRFDDAVEVLQSFSLIYIDTDERTGLRRFSIHPMIQYCASARVQMEIQNYWRAQAIALICHAFPSDEALEPL